MSEVAGVVAVAAPVVTAEEAAAAGLSAAQAAAVTALVQAQAAGRVRLLAGTSVFLARLLRRFTGWYDEAAVLALASTADTQVRAAQQASADLTLAYQRQMLARLGVTLSKAEASRARLVVPSSSEPGLRGVDFLTEWERPVKTYRYERSAGATDDAAIEAAVARAQRMADAAESLAMRRAVRRALSVAAGLDPDAPDDPPPTTLDLADADFKDFQASLATPDAPLEPPGSTPAAPTTGARVRVVGYRRVLHPELSRAGVCGLCVVAAGRIYTVKQVLETHPNCHCETAPVVETGGRVEDPGKALNDVDMQRLYEAAGGTSRELLGQVRVRVDEHGELGPVLVEASAKSRSPRQARQALRDPGESAVDKARRLRDLTAGQVTYLAGLVAAGQAKYQVTLDIQRRLLKQREAVLRTAERAA